MGFMEGCGRGWESCRHACLYWSYQGEWFTLYLHSQLYLETTLLFSALVCDFINLIWFIFCTSIFPLPLTLPPPYHACYKKVIMAKLVEGDGEEEKGIPGGSNLGLAVSKFLPNKDSIAWGEGQALFKAITDGDIERMKECINASPTAAQAAAIARDEDTGMTPLHYSADRGRADITEVLLANGAMVRIPTTDIHRLSHRLTHVESSLFSHSTHTPVSSTLPLTCHLFPHHATPHNTTPHHQHHTTPFLTALYHHPTTRMNLSGQCRGPWRTNPSHLHPWNPFDVPHTHTPSTHYITHYPTTLACT